MRDYLDSGWFWFFLGATLAWLGSHAAFILWGRKQAAQFVGSDEAVNDSDMRLARFMGGGRHLKLVFDQAPIGMRVADRKGVIRHVNRAFCELVGLREDKLIGKKFHVYCHESLRDRMMDTFQRAMEMNTANPRTGYSLRLWNGEAVHYFVVHTRLDTPEGHIVLSMFVDRTLEYRMQEEMEKSTAEFERLALTDPLTSLGNRRFLFDRLDAEMARTRRYSSPLCLLIIDLDHFKRVNDQYGHRTGDITLERVATIIKDTVRTSDVPARFGGEEFCVILPEAPLEGGVLLAQRLRQKIEQETIVSADGVPFKVTCSVGVAEFGGGDETSPSFFERADHALYTAKQNGRNQVIAAPKVAQS